MRYIFLFLLFPVLMHAQIQKVEVETYYVSDANDATDTTGGYLEPGSVTYRVYVGLVPGSKLKKIYGDANHALKFKSSSVFFNNKEDGQSFGKDFSKNRYGDNTVALDTWLTIGQTTKVTSGAANFGVLKRNDSNGSFVGGANNDGGSSAISTGLLINNDASAGIPLITADGMDTLHTVPSNWGDYGIKDLITGDDSTIFGSIVTGSEFASNNAALQNSGVIGVLPDTNYVLVAQLTTKGALTFEINVEVIDTNGNTIKYVANGDTLLPDETVNPNLKYPLPCGCINPDYLEFSTNYACGNTDSCRTKIVFGCTDPMACNYNPQANFAVQSLCCYPGACNDLDISLVCPTLAIDEAQNNFQFGLYPNPTENYLQVSSNLLVNHSVKYFIMDLSGRILTNENLGRLNSNNLQIPVAQLQPGTYILKVIAGDYRGNHVFIKM